MEETGVRLEGGEVCAVRVESLDLVAVGAPSELQLVVARLDLQEGCLHAEHRSMLMHAQGPKRIFGGLNGGQRFVPPEIPQSNFAVAAP